MDEAHEGTQTELGKAVMVELVKEDTKVLRLSGTPFNLLDDFKENEIYTWDYVMEIYTCEYVIEKLSKQECYKTQLC